MAAVNQLLLRTLNDLSFGDRIIFRDYLQMVVSDKNLPDITSRMRLKGHRAKDLVDLMDIYGEQSLEITREVLMLMNKTDLVRRLSGASSPLKAGDKPSGGFGFRALKFLGLSGKHPSKSSQKELEMLQHKVSETLEDLTYEEVEELKFLLLRDERIPKHQLEVFDKADVVELIVERYGQESVEMIIRALMEMNKRDLVEKLSSISSGSKAATPSAEATSVNTMTDEKHSADEKQPSQNERVEMLMTDIKLLLEAMAHLSSSDLVRFCRVLEHEPGFGSHTHKLVFYPRVTFGFGSDSDSDSDSDSYSGTFTPLSIRPGKTEIVFFMVETYGQKSLKKTMEVLEEIKRTDIVKRLSDSSSGPKEEHSVDEQQFALMHKMATMAAVKDLLLETLSYLSYKELKTFKWFLQVSFFQRGLPHRERQSGFDPYVLTSVLVETCGQQSVEVTKEVLMDMNRPDLAQRLSEISPGPEVKLSVDEYWPALTVKVETMVSLIELLLETLAHLTDTEFSRLKRIAQIERNRLVPNMSVTMLMMTNRQDTVFHIVLNGGEQSVETTKRLLKEVGRTDLVQRLSDSSSQPKDKHSDEQNGALIQKVAMMAAVKQLLLETLHGFITPDLLVFFEFLKCIVYQKGLPQLKSLRYFVSTADDIVGQMVQTYGKQSVDLTRQVLISMKKTDLLEKLSEPASELEEKPPLDDPSLYDLHSGEAKWLLRRTLHHLRRKERQELLLYFKYTWFIKSLPQTPWSSGDVDDLVDLMVEIHGQQSVELTKEVLVDMNKNDQAKSLLKLGSQLRGISPIVFSTKDPPEPLEKEETLTPFEEKLLETLKDLTPGDLEKFKHVLQFTDVKKGFPRIPGDKLESADTLKIMKLVVENYGQDSVKVMMEVLKKINRNDLVQMLSSSSSAETSRGLKLEAAAPLMQDSSDWTKLDPEVKGSDEATTYSLQTGAGRFECSVSGLRWLCEENVCFKYQFCFSEEHEERLESRQYMPAGPLIDITVISGKLDEVYLPHWICTDDDPSVLDKFAVLHIDDCGEDVEDVSPAQVTPFHVKLSEPVFSPRRVLMKIVSVKIRCNVLIYKTNTSFLTLHVYLTPCDPGLQKVMDDKQLSYGYEIIRKPHPEKSLKTRERFSLEADLRGVEICPQTLKLRHESRNLNFFEVYVENPETNFKLSLTHEKERHPVWTCVIRIDDYQSASQVQDKKTTEQSSQLGSSDDVHFVDRHQVILINRVSNVDPILDRLLDEEIIDNGVYGKIRALSTTEDQMRALYSGCLKAGVACKDFFYQLLEEHEKFLMKELKKESG